MLAVRHTACGGLSGPKSVVFGKVFFIINAKS